MLRPPLLWCQILPWSYFGYNQILRKTGKNPQSTLNINSMNEERNSQKYLEAADFLNPNPQARNMLYDHKQTRGNPNFIPESIKSTE